MAVERGEIKRLMIFVPPRHGKSELASIDFPAWYLGKHPEKEIITSSYSAELAQDFGYKTRNLVDTQEYSELFDTHLMEDSKSKAKWLTNDKGGYTAVGVGGAVTGRGANIFIIDDPLKNRQEAESETTRKMVYDWYTSTAYTRLEKDGAVILIMTRWHKYDLAGMLLKKMEDDPDSEQWTVIKFPALAIKDEEFRKQGEPLWPDKYNFAALSKMKTTVGNYDWSALYQQEPIASEDQEFRQEFYQYRSWNEVNALQTRRYLTIDTAIDQDAEADYIGMCLNYYDSNNRWNIKAWRVKESPLQLINDIFSLWTFHNLEAVGIEETIYLKVIKPFFDEECRLRNKFPLIIPLKHKGISKEGRVRALLPYYESHTIFHITGECKDLEEEQMNFPQGMTNDVVDAEAYMPQMIKPFPMNPITNEDRFFLRKMMKEKMRARRAGLR